MTLPIVLLLMAAPAFAAEWETYKSEQAQSVITKGGKSYQKPVTKSQTTSIEEQNPWEIEPAAGLEVPQAEEKKLLHKQIRLPRKF